MKLKPAFSAWIVNVVSSLLERDEREIVRGDLAESGETGMRAFKQVLWLIVRRQIEIWRDWRPWFALLAIALTTGTHLRGIFGVFGGTLFTRLNGFENFRTAREDGVYLFSLAFALVVWSWTMSFILGVLSRRATWLNASILHLIVLGPLVINFILAANAFLPYVPPGLWKPRLVSQLVVMSTFLVPSVLGLSWGLKRQHLTTSQTLVVCLATALGVALLTWTSGFYETNRAEFGAYEPRPWEQRVVPFLWASWPAGFLIALKASRSIGQHSDKEAPTA